MAFYGRNKELNRINGGLIYFHKDDFLQYEVVTDDTRKHILSVGTQPGAAFIAWICGVSDQVFYNPPFG